ncbi:MAG: ABC transporter substrate-binding protein, partial [bacterium]
MQRRHFVQATAALSAAGFALPAALAQQQRAICYNCPPEWADWGGMLRLINQRINVSVPPDNKNSGQAMA